MYEAATKTIHCAAFSTMKKVFFPLRIKALKLSSYSYVADLQKNGLPRKSHDKMTFFWNLDGVNHYIHLLPLILAVTTFANWLNELPSK